MRRVRRALSQINVVPYIDVMLVLLVIFMVTTPIMQTATVQLPNVDQASKTTHKIPLQLTIQTNGHYAIQDTGQAINYHTEDQLIQHITQVLINDLQRPVVIAADKSISYEKVMHIMNRLKQAHVAQVGLLVQSK